jgi:phosphatidylserine/phosphatidylglycerophosphate/cardiolipin synthase-like enzyme/V8-like Glu-specific endopeptidase
LIGIRADADHLVGATAMLIDSAIVSDIESRWRSYGGDRLPPRDLTAKAAAAQRPAADAAPASFWQKRGLQPRPDGRGFRAVLPAAPAEGLSLPPDLRAERILGSSDLIEIVFLEVALAVARTVARVRVNGPSGILGGYGTGFMVSPRLFLTNNHVLKAADIARVSVAEFGFETRLGEGAARPGVAFRLEPERFYLSEPALDFTLVAIAPVSIDGSRQLKDFGFNRLVDNDTDLITEGQFSNIIQHPSGQPKQLAFRQNEVIAKPADFLHYRTDTAPGSSGAPVFNDQWQVVALHRAGVWATNDAGQILAIDGTVWRDGMGEDRIRWLANEGARIPRLLARWRDLQRDTRQGELLDELFAPGAPSVTDRLETQLPPNNPAPVQQSTSGAPPSQASVTVSADGIATWTLPLQVSVALGALPQPRAPQEPAAPPQTPPAADASIAAPDLDTVLRHAREKLMAGRTDVIGIRDGWTFDDNGITDTRALVVTVKRKRPPAELAAAGVTELPSTFMGYPVEIMGPTVEDLLRQNVGPQRTEAMMEATVTAEEILYRPPPDLSLDPVTATMRVVAHVSPDAGWATLRPFIAGARRRLVGAMYEFTAEHVREALTAAAQRQGFEKLTLALDSARGSPNNPAHIRDSEAMVRDMREVLGDRLEVSWVKRGSVNGWIEHDYHIKVLVRDGKAFWLSSGNWKPSGQPEQDPRNDQAMLRRLLLEENREWHVIIEHAGLAATYQKAILHDFENNRLTRPEEFAEILPELWFLSAARPLAEEALAAVTFFEPFDERREFTVRPILTPDNYLDAVVPVVKSAQHSILLQNQTLKRPKPENDPRFHEFWSTVAAKQQQGLDVRLIFRIHEMNPAQARVDFEELRRFGFDPRRIKIQKGCHTKGLVIDGKKVLIGSHNLSNMGATTNRDASLLFDDQSLAEYFTRLFEHDWRNVAEVLSRRHWRGSEFRMAEGGAAPEGFTRFDWGEWFETR